MPEIKLDWDRKRWRFKSGINIEYLRLNLKYTHRAFKKKYSTELIEILSIEEKDENIWWCIAS